MSADRETFGYEMLVDMTEDELNQNNARNTDIDIKILSIKGEQKLSNDIFKERIAVLAKEQKPLLERKITKKWALEIQCYNERDERLARMLTLRCDTGEQVDERALTAEERGQTPDDRQGNLFDSNAASSLDAGSEDEPEERGDEDTERHLAEYAAQSAAAGESNVSTSDDAGDDDDDSDLDDAGDDDSEGVPAH